MSSKKSPKMTTNDAYYRKHLITKCFADTILLILLAASIGAGHNLTLRYIEKPQSEPNIRNG